MPFIEGKEVRIGISEQTTFGTRIVDAGTFVELFADTMQIDRDVRNHKTGGTTGSKNMTYIDNILTVEGSMPKFPLVGPFSLYYSDFLLFSFFQKVTEGVATPYTKTFVPYSVHPDFPSDEGKFLTVIKRYPTASESRAMTDCICVGLKLSAERDGMLMHELQMVGRGAAELDSNPSGTWEKGLDGPGGADAKASQYGILFFNDMDIATLNIDGGGATNITLKNFSIDVSYDIEGVGVDGAGGPLTYGLSNRTAQVTFSILHDTIVETALASQEADGSAVLTLNWGAAGAAVNGELEIIVTGKMSEIPFDEDGLIAAEITMDLASATTATEFITINMSNDIDRVF